MLMKKFLLVLLACFLVACGHSQAPAKLYGADIGGADFVGDFELLDHHGAKRQMSDYQGKVVVLFFGYTHCPDVCPTAMADMAKMMKLLGSDANQVQVLFVTLDPERDSQQVLAKYVPSFDERFVGLYGNAQQTAEVAKRYKVFFEKKDVAGKSGYTIDHSAGAFVFDKAGKVRIYFRNGQKPNEMASDLKQLL
jgi:protein SCO1/2